MVTLETVEIPGLREAIKRESRIRDAAFLDGLMVVCGVEIVPLSLRRLIWLEQAHNGFVVPWKWESADETFAHAVQLLYFLRPGFSAPRSPVESFCQSFRSGWSEQMFARRMARKERSAIIQEISEYIAECFMDAPTGGGSEIMPPSYVSYPVYIIDLFAEAGLTFGYSEIMDMPLARLWQMHRIASRRIWQIKLTNPSDEIAVAHLSRATA